MKKKKRPVASHTRIHTMPASGRRAVAVDDFYPSTRTSTHIYAYIYNWMRVCLRVEHHRTVAWSLCVRFPADAAAAAVAAARSQSPRLCHPSYFFHHFSPVLCIHPVHISTSIYSVCARVHDQWHGGVSAVCARHYTATTPRFFCVCLCSFFLSVFVCTLWARTTTGTLVVVGCNWGEGGLRLFGAQMRTFRQGAAEMMMLSPVGCLKK